MMSNRSIATGSSLRSLIAGSDNVIDINSDNNKKEGGNNGISKEKIKNAFQKQENFIKGAAEQIVYIKGAAKYFIKEQLIKPSKHCFVATRLQTRTSYRTNLRGCSFTVIVL